MAGSCLENLCVSPRFGETSHPGGFDKEFYSCSPWGHEESDTAEQLNSTHQLL